MKKEDSNKAKTRRDFMKTLGAAGAAGATVGVTAVVPACGSNPVVVDDRHPMTSAILEYYPAANAAELDSVVRQLDAEGSLSEYHDATPPTGYDPQIYRAEIATLLITKHANFRRHLFQDEPLEIRADTIRFVDADY